MIQITTILQDVLEAQSKTPEGGNNGNGDSTKTKSKCNTNDKGMSIAQISKRCHPKINSYFHSCSYDLPHKHNSKTCKWKKEGHKYEATIKNKMGGL